MKKWVLLLVFISSGTLLSQENKGAYEIYGEIEGVDRGKVSLVFYNGDSPKKARIKDGRFYFKGKIEHTTRTSFRINDSFSSTFYLDNSSIRLKLKLFQYEDLTFDGIQIPKDIYKPMYGIVEMNGNQVEDEYLVYTRFDREQKENSDVDRLLFDYLQKKIEDSPNNYLYFDILYSLALENKYLSPNQILKLTEGMNTSYIDFETKKKFVEVIQRNRS